MSIGCALRANPRDSRLARAPRGLKEASRYEVLTRAFGDLIVAQRNTRLHPEFVADIHIVLMAHIVLIEEQEHRHGHVRDIMGLVCYCPLLAPCLACAHILTISTPCTLAQGILASRIPGARYLTSIEFRKLLLQGAAAITGQPQGQCVLSIYDNPDGFVRSDGTRAPSVWAWDEGQRHDCVTDAVSKDERDALHLACLLVWFGFSSRQTAAFATAWPSSALSGAMAVARRSYETNDLARQVAAAGKCILLVELHHDGFNAADPFGIYVLIQLDNLSLWDRVSIPDFSVLTSSSSLPTTLPLNLSRKGLAVDWCEMEAPIDRRTPHFLINDIDKAIEDCRRKATARDATEWTRRRASRAAGYLEDLKSRSRAAAGAYDRSGQTRMCDVSFTRSGVRSMDGSTSGDDMAVAMTGGRWMDSSVSRGFSFTFCSADTTVLVLGAKQTQADAKNAFFAADRLFLVAHFGSVAAAKRECPGYMNYSEVEDESARPRQLKEAATAWDLPLDKASEDRSRYTAKARLCACSNGSGRQDDPKCAELRKSVLALKLIDETDKVRRAAWNHPVIVPQRDALWRRAGARAAAKFGVDKYDWIGPNYRLEELQWRSFLSFCRREIEARVLCLMICGFGSNGYRTTCHVCCNAP